MRLQTIELHTKVLNTKVFNNNEAITETMDTEKRGSPNNIALVSVISLFVLLWSWAHRDQLVPAKQAARLLNDIEIVKSAAFPDEVTPIGSAYAAIGSSDTTWERYSSHKGVQVVVVKGTLADKSIIKSVQENFFDVPKLCRTLPSVAQFLGPDFPDHLAEQFHRAALAPNDYPLFAIKEGFALASKEYLSAIKAHLSAEIRFETQFPLKVDRASGDVLGKASPFIIGASAITFSSGPLAGKKFSYAKFSELVSSH